jgi:hypothetical protein
MIFVEHAVVVSTDPVHRVPGDGAVLGDGPRSRRSAGPPRCDRPPDRVIDGQARLVLPGFVA